VDTDFFRPVVRSNGSDRNPALQKIPPRIELRLAPPTLGLGAQLPVLRNAATTFTTNATETSNCTAAARRECPASANRTTRRLKSMNGPSSWRITSVTGNEP
jgi:hypothetical protein